MVQPVRSYSPDMVQLIRTYSPDMVQLVRAYSPDMIQPVRTYSPDMVQLVRIYSMHHPPGTRGRWGMSHPPQGTGPPGDHPAQGLRMDWAESSWPPEDQKGPWHSLKCQLRKPRPGYHPYHAGYHPHHAKYPPPLR